MNEGNCRKIEIYGDKQLHNRKQVLKTRERHSRERKGVRILEFEKSSLTTIKSTTNTDFTPIYFCCNERNILRHKLTDLGATWKQSKHRKTAMFHKPSFPTP